MPRPTTTEPRTPFVVVETAMVSVAFIVVLALTLGTVIDTRTAAGPGLDTWRKSELTQPRDN